ncbi:hypothetical protein TBS_30320 [Thermobispora bispora]
MLWAGAGEVAFRPERAGAGAGWRLRPERSGGTRIAPLDGFRGSLGDDVRFRSVRGWGVHPCEVGDGVARGGVGKPRPIPYGRALRRTGVRRSFFFSGAVA